jgi:hypothetical protein
MIGSAQTHRGESEMESKANYIDLFLKRCNEPPMNTIVFNIQGEFMFPCIVKSGKFFADNGRLSNAWTWLNLHTGKEESGYGCFFVPQDNKEVPSNEP